MIITISGDPGSGKSTVAKELAKELGFKHYSGGDMRGLLAKDKGLTIDQLNELGEKEDWTDRQIDERIAKLGQEEDDFVIDSRLAWHFIPGSYKIFLTCEPKEAAKRILNSKRIQDQDRSDEPDYKDENEVAEEIMKRVESDKKRYMKIYGLDHTDKSHYDLVIDTTGITQGEAIDAVLEHVKKLK